MAAFGDIAGVEEGAWYPSRYEVRQAGLHRHTVAGISGRRDEGADAIVLAGGYEDDEDHGDLIIYTGEGGNRDGRQVADQTFTKGNRALAVNATQGLPVRVIRGHKHRSPWSPTSGYTYAGLYTVESNWHGAGKSGFRVYRYRLVKVADADPVVAPTFITPPTGQAAPAKVAVLTSRTVRDTAVTRWVKQQHDHRCQVCETRLETPAGPYAEGCARTAIGKAPQRA